MAQDSPNGGFIYDFLYLDRSRIDSWLAQLMDEGVLRSFKQVASVSDGHNASAGFSLKVIKGKLGDTGTSNEGFERTFDSQWSLPLMLIDRLSEEGMIHDELSSATLGQLVVLSGQVQITDVALLQKIWKPAIKVMISQQKPTHATKAQLAELQRNLESIGEAIQAMPADPQIYLRDKGGDAIWASLREDQMLVNTSTLALAHGSSLKGEWRMLAVLDAKPDDGEEDFVAPISTADMSETMHAVVNLVRQLVGRSADAYAVTPLAIYRAIRGREEASN